MSQPVAPPWQPTRVKRFIEGYDTSMGTARIETAAGEAYIKALGNRQGPHPLACELVATALARWFGLPTFDNATVVLGEAPEIPFRRGGQAQPGPAFVARDCPGRTWSGDPVELETLENPDDISRLVVFDNWALNCDRHPPDLAMRKVNYNNVYLSSENLPAERCQLVAMDHTHCFTCGSDLSQRMADIDHERDGRLYGLFPAFLYWLRPGILEESSRRLRQIDPQTVNEILARVPREWEVPSAVLPVWERLICRRAVFVADEVIKQLLALCP